MEWLFGIKYKVWAVSTIEQAELYLWKNWKLLMTDLQPLIQLSTKQTFIRTFQSYEFQNKWLGFGRMKWNEENNKKWSTKYRNNLKSEKLRFFKTEIWSPDWNFCINNGQTPDIFINLYHYEGIESLKEGILIAIRQKLVKQNKELVESCVAKLNQNIENSQVSLIERYWTPGKGYPNRIEDMNPHELEQLIKMGAV